MGDKDKQTQTKPRPSDGERGLAPILPVTPGHQGQGQGDGGKKGGEGSKKNG